MYRFVRPQTPLDQEQFCSPGGPSALMPEQVARQRPDAQWMLLTGAGDLAGRCSLWLTSTPALADERLGYVGHWAARDAESARLLLEHACAQLAPHCTRAVAPIDGSTWGRYRLLTERGPEPVFFLEPDNPDDWPGHFIANRFTPLAQYYSALNDHLDRPDPRTGELASRLAASGVRMRCLDMACFEQELRALYPLVLAAFARNFLYTPLAEEDFLAQYLGVRAFLRPELVLVVERDDRPVGFILAVPDLLQARRGQPVDTVILKTLAVHPEEAGAGLGTLLVAHCQNEAARLGYRRAIHALMYETNNSRKISSHTARTIRRYTLFARTLGARP
jgi:GNAT superfamily N-acetyltransferase